MKYWTGGEYLGFGPSASSDFAGKRFTLRRDLQGYIQGIKNGGEVMEDVQDIPLRERAGEYLMLRLRTASGISAEEYERLFLLPFAPLEDVLEKHREFYYVHKNEEGRWSLTTKGFLVSNSIISDLLLAQDGSEPLRRI
jgi:oxygen-independent coproporphyrinogen-3 oxidase